MDSNNLKFACSKLGDLMTNGRGKNAGMGETAKNLIFERWVAQKYNRRPFFSSLATDKGEAVEEDSFTLYTKVKDVLLLKNETFYENDIIRGVPDAVESDYVLDIKSPLDIFTFAKAGMTKQYEWQLRGYMMLTDTPRAVLAYCLVDMPEEMLERKLMYIEGEKQYETIKRLYTYGDIPEEDRVKTFEIERDEEKEAALVARVKEARIFAQDFKL